MMRLTDVLHIKFPEYCPCGYRISIANRYCPHCGKKIELPIGTHKHQSCHTCGTEHEVDAYFCGRCGVRFTA